MAISYTSFKDVFHEVFKRLERRRAFYKLYVVTLLIVAGVTAAILFLGRSHAGMGGLEYAIKGIFTVICVLFLAMGVIFYYRTQNTGGFWRRSSSLPLRVSIYFFLLKCFGRFELSSGGGAFMTEMLNATILPTYRLYTAEDCIRIFFHDMTVRMAETQLLQLEGVKRSTVFTGLVILVDISDSRIKLRSSFKGRTVLVAGKYAEPPVFPEGVEAKRVPEELIGAQQVEAYSSDLDEAATLVSEESIAALIDIQNAFRESAIPVKRWDSKLAGLIDDAALWVGEKILNILPNRFFEVIIPEEAHDPSKPKLPKKTTPNGRTVNRQAQIEFYEDKILITVPCKHTLFEIDSLFEPALALEDARIFYTALQAAERIASHVNAKWV